MGLQSRWEFLTKPEATANVFFLASALWLVVVLPMTTLGFGSDGDSWRVARAADDIWRNEEYVKSRSTGFPLFEILMAPMVSYGSWYLSNQTVAAFGLAFIGAIFALYKKGFIQHPVGVLIQTAFLPIFVKNASSTMDYIPAVCLILWSYYNLLRRNYFWCAALIGLSCGFRLTSIIFVLPAAVYMVMVNAPLKKVVLFSAIAAVVALLSFSPALIKYGIPDPHGNISIEPKLLIIIGGYYFLMLYGLIPSLILTVVFFYILVRDKKSDLRSEKYFQLTAIACVVLLFALMPDEPEYLLPVVPMIALYLDPRLSRRWFLILGCVLLSYHFVRLETLGGESGRRSIELSFKSGLTVQDVQHRINILKLRDAATHFKTSTPIALLIGDVYISTLNENWVYDDRYRMYRQRYGLLFVSGRIRDESRLMELKRHGFRIVVPNDSKWEYLRTNNTFWRNYVEVIYDVNSFLSTQKY